MYSQGGRSSRFRTRRGIHVQSGSVVEDSIVLDNCIIGCQCRIRRTIVDENVTLAEGVNVGYDLEQDRARHHVTDAGIVVVTSRSANRMIVDSRAEGGRGVIKVLITDAETCRKPVEGKPSGKQTPVERKHCGKSSEMEKCHCNSDGPVGRQAFGNPEHVRTHSCLYSSSHYYFMGNFAERL